MANSFYLFIVALVGLSQSATVTMPVSDAVQARYEQILQDAYPYSDLKTAYYAVRGLKLLNKAPKNAAEVCKFLQSNTDSSSVESLFYGSYAAKLLGSCTLTVSDKSVLTNTLTADDSTSEQLMYAIQAMKQLSVPVDDKKAAEKLKAAVKKQDKYTSLGYAMHAASLLKKSEATQFHTYIEDAIAQGNIVNGQYFRYDEGLPTTSLVVTGAFKLAETCGQSPAIDAGKLVQAAEYFVSRAGVKQVVPLTLALDAFRVLANNKFQVPMVISLASPAEISEQNRVVSVRVTNILGQSIDGVKNVVVDNAKNTQSDAIVVSRAEMSPKKSGQSTIFELDLMAKNPPRGFYKLQLSAKAPASQYIPVDGKTISVKVMYKVEIVDAGFDIYDADHAPKLSPIQYRAGAAPLGRTGKELSASQQEAISLSFRLKDSAAAADDQMAQLPVQQVFARFTKIDSGNEVFFVVEKDASTSEYRFDLMVKTKAKVFAYHSGRYQLDILIGDAAIENPIEWAVAEIDLRFAGSPPSKEETLYDVNYNKRPDITHMFREPEKRPPAIVSLVFTGLCLSPLLVLIAFWGKLGVNLGRFPGGHLSAYGFHLGLGAILALYATYWLKLNMFQTAKILAPLALFTFLTGNRLLRSIASKREKTN